MPPRASSASQPAAKNLVGDSLYEWARSNKDAGDTLTQDDLLDSGIIPGRDLRILIDAVQHLLNKRLFRPVDVKTGGLGYQLVEQSAAQKYDMLVFKPTTSNKLLATVV